MRNSSLFSFGCFFLIVFIFLCMCLCSFILVIGASSLSSEMLSEVVYKDGDTNNKIAVIDISGTIAGGETTDLFGNTVLDPVRIVLSQLDRAQSDDDVKAVVLRFNTGGGTVYDSFKIADAVREFKSETGKPIVALVETSAASGGYLIASQADYIVSDQTSILGSIGVIAQITNDDGFWEMLGIDIIRITSDGAEQKSGENIIDPTSPEYQNLKGLLNDYQELFNEYVAEGRDLTLQEVKQLADGSISSGIAAKEKGLVDYFGDLDFVIEKIESENSLENSTVIIYIGDMTSLWGNIGIFSNIPGFLQREKRGLEVIF